MSGFNRGRHGSAGNHFLNGGDASVANNDFKDLFCQCLCQAWTGSILFNIGPIQIRCLGLFNLWAAHGAIPLSRSRRQIPRNSLIPLDSALSSASNLRTLEVKQ